MKCGKYDVFFRNLSNPVRIKIINCLKEGNCFVSELCDKTGIEQSKISHALACLRNCRIVNAERQGKKIIYSINKETVLPILKILDKHRCKYCNIK